MNKPEPYAIFDTTEDGKFLLFHWAQEGVRCVPDVLEEARRYGHAISYTSYKYIGIELSPLYDKQVVADYLVTFAYDLFNKS